MYIIIGSQFFLIKILKRLFSESRKRIKIRSREAYPFSSHERTSSSLNESGHQNNNPYLQRRRLGHHYRYQEENQDSLN